MWLAACQVARVTIVPVDANNGGLTMRQWRHVPPLPISGPKNRPRIPTQFKYLRSLIFIIAPFGHRQSWCYTYRRKAKIDSSLCTYAVVCQLKRPNMTGCVKLHVNFLLRFVIRIMSFMFCSLITRPNV